MNHKKSCAMINTCVTYTMNYGCLGTADERIVRCFEQQVRFLQI